jgi:hypothetical protein
VPDPVSNDVFQAAVNNAALFKVVLCLVGLVCIVMGYRLLAARTERISGEPQRLRHAGAGVVLGMFGMCIISVALFRDAPAKLQGEARAQAVGPTGRSVSISSEMKRNTAATSIQPTTEDFSNVREIVDSPIAPLVTNETNFGTNFSTAAEEIVRPAREVRTKGAYVPLNRRPANEANR